jgi:hypothetical protein
MKAAGLVIRHPLTKPIVSTVCPACVPALTIAEKAVEVGFFFFHYLFTLMSNLH